jgi:hypothetical protein
LSLNWADYTETNPQQPRRFCPVWLCLWSTTTRLGKPNARILLLVDRPSMAILLDPWLCLITCSTRRSRPWMFTQNVFNTEMKANVSRVWRQFKRNTVIGCKLSPSDAPQNAHSSKSWPRLLLVLP